MNKRMKNGRMWLALMMAIVALVNSGVATFGQVLKAGDNGEGEAVQEPVVVTVTEASEPAEETKPAETPAATEAPKTEEAQPTEAPQSADAESVADESEPDEDTAPVAPGSVRITYKVKGNGSVSLRSEVVSAGGKPAGSVAKADEGYVFVGWKNAEGKIISTKTELIPDLAGVGEKVTFTAVFKPVASEEAESEEEAEEPDAEEVTEAETEEVEEAVDEAPEENVTDEAESESEEADAEAEDESEEDAEEAGEEESEEADEEESEDADAEESEEADEEESEEADEEESEEADEEEEAPACTCEAEEGEAHSEDCPLYVEPRCTCDAQIWEGDDHSEDCPLYVEPECTCDAEDDNSHTEDCPLYDKYYVHLNVSVSYVNRSNGEIRYGSNIRVQSSVTNAPEGVELHYQWFFSTDGSTWFPIGGDADHYDFVLDETNATYYWRVKAAF